MYTYSALAIRHLTVCLASNAVSEVRQLFTTKPDWVGFRRGGVLFSELACQSSSAARLRLNLFYRPHQHACDQQ